MLSHQCFSAILCLLLAAAAVPSHAETHYNTVYNSFGGLDWQGRVQASITGKTLLGCNDTPAPLLLLDTTQVTAASYRFYARLRNRHNAEGKSYKVAGKKQDHTTAGIVFRHVSDNDYWCATLHAFSSNPHDDLRDKRMMRLSVRHILEGRVAEQRDSDMTDGFDLRDGYNVIGVEVNGSMIAVMAGDNELRPLMRLNIPASGMPEHIGCLVGPGAMAELERTVLSFKTNDRVEVNTGWTKASLDAHFAASHNPIEGYWQYLDRDMEDTWLRLGGRYTIAVIQKTGQTGEYELVYVDGAEVKPKEWNTGMLKGSLSRTIFTGHYTATWIDATHRSMGKDVTASIENGVILTLSFPVYKSQVRFSKIIKQ